MKYEFVFKVRENRVEGFQTRYRCVVDAAHFNHQKSTYEKLQKLHPEWDSVILINEFDDFKNFIRVIQ